MELLILVLFIILSYIVGSIPFGYILTKKSTGLNILRQGSGNIGSTNVGRIAGKWVALKVQVLDMLKGFIPVATVLIFSKSEVQSFPDYFIFLVAISTILGHNFSVFLLFKGGKGVNTTLGATVLLAPAEVFCSAAAYFLIKWPLKYVSVGSIALAIMLPFSALILEAKGWLIYYLTFCCIMILYRHKSNIKRLISGNELKP